MDPSAWIALGALVLVFVGAPVGAVWLLVRTQISGAQLHATNAHTRISAHREEVAADFGRLREKLASEYVKTDHLRERLAEVMQPINDAQASQKRQLDRIENFQMRLMNRLHIPAVMPEEPDS